MRDWLRVCAAAACAITSACTDDAPCTSGEPGTVCRIAGSGESGYNGDGLPAVDSNLSLPTQVRRGPDGLVYVMDMNNMRLRRIEADGTMSTVAGKGEHAGAEVGANALASSLENPIDFDWLPDGRLVFVSSHDPRLLVIDTDGTLQNVAGGLWGSIGNEGDRGPATLARFVEPGGLAVAPDGTIYIADRTANRVRVIAPDGIINTLAGTGIPGFEGDGGPAINARLTEPTALTVDAAGNLYVTDTGNCAVRRIAPDGTIATVAGIGYPGFGGDGGPADRAMLAHPEGVAVAPDGSLFIGDRFNNRIRRVAPDGTIATMAGTGTKGLAGDGGAALEADFGRVSRVQLDTDGGLLIADQTNATVRKVVAAP